MVFSAEDTILIKELRETKGYGAMRLITDFPMKIGLYSWCQQAVKKDCHNRTRIRDVEHLRERLIEERSRFDQRIIDGAISISGVSDSEPVCALKAGNSNINCDR